MGHYCNGYHYFTTSLSKTWTQALGKFKFLLMACRKFTMANISDIGLWWTYEHSRYLLYKLENLINRFDNLSIWRFDDLTTWRFEILSSELAVSKNFNCLLSERIIKLRKNAVNNAQYYRSESIEISSVPASISNEELEDNVCKALCLSLTGHEVIPDNFQGCHRLKKRGLWL